MRSAPERRDGADLDVGPIREALLAWGERNRRDLPWRHTRDPWLVLVSEVMLQQTQAARVAPRWVELCERFPTPAHLAAASVGDVLRLWHGLGYPRRAVNLHRTAVRLVDGHGGRVPRDLDALLSLPGVGAYTARAVLAFAHEQDVGVVDTNAGRVLARLCGRGLRPCAAQELADSLVPVGSGWAWNQSMLDLAAAVCTKKAPACDRCPLARSCGWRGRAGADPATGSAGTSGRQAPYAGSDREARGRLLAALGRGPVPVTEAGEVMGTGDDDARAHRLVDALRADGLVEVSGGRVALPG